MTPPTVIPIRLLLVDDQELFREAIGTVLGLDDRFEIAGEASNGADAVTMALRLRPDVVLMDLRMPGLSGTEATRRIHTAQPEICILVLTTFDDETDVLEALRRGAAGYALKNLPSADLKAAILSVAAGGTYLPPAALCHVVGEYRRLARTHPSGNTDPRLATLSERQLDILRCLLKGLSNKQIAAELGLTEGTVKNHFTAIFTKFNAPDRTAVALIARDIGIVPHPHVPA
jgi:DNA-binding NarL/FixJ family response regulator